MIWKPKLLLICLFLSPLMNGQDRNKQIQELKDCRLKKMQALSNLGKKIVKKDQLLRSIPQTMDMLTDQSGLNINLHNEKSEEFRNATRNMIEILAKTLEEKIFAKRNVKHFLVKELLTRNNDRQNFETLKFFAVRYIFEESHLKALVEQYEEDQQELIEIEERLAELQKQ